MKLILPILAGVAGGVITSYLLRSEEEGHTVTELRIVERPENTDAPSALSNPTVVDGGRPVAITAVEEAVESYATAAPRPGDPSTPTGATLHAEAVLRHEAEPVDYSWSRAMSWNVDTSMEGAAVRLGATAGPADCRSETCTVMLTWPDQATAERMASLAAETNYENVPCSRFISLGSDGGAEGPVQATLIFECRGGN